jgi:hypothetical protein
MIESYVIKINIKIGLYSVFIAELNIEVVNEFEKFNSRKFSIVIVDSFSESDSVDNICEFSKKSVVKLSEILNKLSKKKISNYLEAGFLCSCKGIKGICL